MQVVRRSAEFVRIPVPAREVRDMADAVAAITRDGIDLFLQSAPDPRGVVLYLHGRGGEFSLGMSSWLPMLMKDLPVVHASANMRCHSMGYNVRAADDDPTMGLRGAFWEDTDAGPEDVVAAVAFLEAEYPGLPILLVGHSAGGFYTATGAAAVDHELAGRILLSPLVTRHWRFGHWFGSPEEIDKALTRCREMVAEGQGHVLIPLPADPWVLSAFALVKRADEAPDAWHRALEKRTSPVFMGWSMDERRPDSDFRGNFEQINVPVKSYFTLTGSDHNYDGYEAEVAAHVAEFIRGALS